MVFGFFALVPPANVLFAVLHYDRSQGWLKIALASLALAVIGATCFAVPLSVLAR